MGRTSKEFEGIKKLSFDDNWTYRKSLSTGDWFWEVKSGERGTVTVIHTNGQTQTFGGKAGALIDDFEVTVVDGSYDFDDYDKHTGTL